MAFFLITLSLLVPVRQMGWVLSRRVLYRAGWGVSVFLAITWGVAVAVGIHLLIRWLHPNLALKIVMGYMLGAYLAQPNFGLFNESSVPDHVMPRHAAMKVLPLITFALCVTALAFAAR